MCLSPFTRLSIHVHLCNANPLPLLPLIPFSVKNLKDSCAVCKLLFLIASNFHSDSFLILFNTLLFPVEGYMLSQQWTDKSSEGHGERFRGLVSIGE